MKMINIKLLSKTTALGIFALVALNACDKGTEPGETNVERSIIVETEQPEKDYTARDSANYEHYYDKADKRGTVYEGDGKSKGVERDEVKKN